jgi:hypothetical protein
MTALQEWWLRIRPGTRDGVSSTDTVHVRRTMPESLSDFDKRLDRLMEAVDELSGDLDALHYRYDTTKES